MARRRKTKSHRSLGVPTAPRRSHGQVAFDVMYTHVSVLRTASPDLIDTGERPYACSYPMCCRRFSVQSNLKRHARVHSQGDVQKHKACQTLFKTQHLPTVLYPPIAAPCLSPSASVCVDSTAPSLHPLNRSPTSLACPQLLQIENRTSAPYGSTVPYVEGSETHTSLPFVPSPIDK
jgi:hypothetical protein